MPEYRIPPLTEVVFAAQFVPPRQYNQIFAKDVWDLFKSEFPEAAAYPALPPSFETFGRPPRRGSGLQLQAGAAHDRFWFLSQDQTQLIQFQQDRLMHNWRKMNDDSNVYPRFDSILPTFGSELKDLEGYFIRTFQANELSINQCELTYVNHIPLNQDRLSKWLRDLARFDDDDYEGISFSTSKVLIADSDGDRPFARFICSCSIGQNEQMARIIDLRFIVRGTPLVPTIDGALDFMREGRIAIVSTFDNITTDYAHSHWEKK